MGFLDDAFKVGDSFVDRLGETLQDAGWVLAAPAATAVDLARAGFDKDVTVGGSLLTGFQRGTQLFFGDKNKGEQNLLSPGVAKVINRIDDPAEIASLLEKNGGGLLAGFGKRHDAALDFIVQPTAAGKTRTATEIYAAFGGLQHSTDGAAISNLMENTVRNLRTKGFGDAQIKDQVKLISRAGMGDRTALKEIDGSVSEIKDALAQLYSSRSDLQKAADMAVASRPRVFVGGPGGLVEDVAARGEDYFASAEFIRLTDARLKAVQKDIRAAEQESARQEKLRIFFAPGKGSKYGSLADQPLLASAATASTKGLERRAAREAGEPARLDFVFQSSLW